MLEEIKTAYSQGRLMLLLGAGASANSTDYTDLPLPLGDGLAKELADYAKLKYEGEPLATVYSAIEGRDSALLHKYIEKRFTNTKPSGALSILAKFPWQRIYTLNIDDSVDTAVQHSKIQRKKILNRNDPLVELNILFEEVQIIKLNGDASQLSKGLVFSQREYGVEASTMPVWYRELAQDYSNYKFVFVGSQLNEPLFHNAIATIRKTANRSQQRAYLITPNATEIEKAHLESLNIEHVAGTLDEFAKWMEETFPSKPSTRDMAIARRPELNGFKQLTNRDIRAFSNITLVDDDSLPKNTNQSNGKIRDFYKGYKPQWADITEGVPANLHFVSEFLDLIAQKAEKKKVLALVGPAGSGKTTAIMLCALDLSRKAEHPVYFLREQNANLKEIIECLEERNQEKFYLFIDKIDGVHHDLYNILSSASSKNVCVILSERQHIWDNRIKPILGTEVSGEKSIQKITLNDAKIILDKLEKFGPWTRLKELSPQLREKEIYNNSDKQLLIGLMEATTGLGFTKIIQNDYDAIGDIQHRQFLLLVGLATVHRANISSAIVGRALNYLNVKQTTNTLAKEVTGIIVSHGDKFAARHSVYIRELFAKIIDPDELMDCIIALLKAYSEYETPIRKSISKSDGIVFKSVCNHRFLKEMMRNDETRVLSIYSTFETVFHSDALYWLQYGLALRAFGHQQQAMEKLKTAREAYSSPHTEHAYAQQLMIMASSEIAEWHEAEPLLNEAIALFENIDTLEKQADSYPIVTLAENHVSIINKFKGVGDARRLASTYATKLMSVARNSSDDRLQESAKKLISFATSSDASWISPSETLK